MGALLLSTYRALFDVEAVVAHDLVSSLSRSPRSTSSHVLNSRCSGSQFHLRSSYVQGESSRSLDSRTTPRGSNPSVDAPRRSSRAFRGEPLGRWSKHDLVRKFSFLPQTRRPELKLTFSARSFRSSGVSKLSSPSLPIHRTTLLPSNLRRPRSDSSIPQSTKIIMEELQFNQQVRRRVYFRIFSCSSLRSRTRTRLSWF